MGERDYAKVFFIEPRMLTISSFKFFIYTNDFII